MSETTSKLLNKKQFFCLHTQLFSCRFVRVPAVEEVPEVQPENQEQRGHLEMTDHLVVQEKE